MDVGIALGPPGLGNFGFRAMDILKLGPLLGAFFGGVGSCISVSIWCILICIACMSMDRTSRKLNGLFRDSKSALVGQTLSGHR